MGPHDAAQAALQHLRERLAALEPPGEPALAHVFRTTLKAADADRETAEAEAEDARASLVLAVESFLAVHRDDTAEHSGGGVPGGRFSQREGF